MRIYFDSETSGLVAAPTYTLQVAIDNGPVEIVYLPTGWQADPAKRVQVGRLLELLWSPDSTVVVFNLSFDVYAASMVWHQLLGEPFESGNRVAPPPRNRPVDLYIHALVKSDLAPYLLQGGRPVATLRRLPEIVGEEVAQQVEDELRTRIPEALHEFLKRKEHRIEDRPDLISYSWTIRGRMSLKGLMRFYGLPTLDLAEFWPLPSRKDNEEVAVWPYPQPWHERNAPVFDRILADTTSPFHVYSKLDILYLRVLDEKLGYPTTNYNDICAQAVGFTRYAGLGLDRPLLLRTVEFYEQQRDQAKALMGDLDLNSPKERVAFLRANAPAGFPIASSGKAVLEMIVKSPDMPDSLKAAAKAMRDFKSYEQRLVQARLMRDCKTGRFHPDFRVVGTPTDRMSGSSGLNPQGISKKMEHGGDGGGAVGLRAVIEADGGGDFDALEMTIGADYYGDVNLKADLANKIDPHLMAGILMDPLFPTRDYAEAARLKKAEDKFLLGRRNEQNKKANFSIGYLCTYQKVAAIYGMSDAEGKTAMEAFFNHYKEWGKARAQLEEDYCTADIDHWTLDSIERMKDYSENMFGDRRWFTFDKEVADLFWRFGHKSLRLTRTGRIVRQKEKGEQTFAGAVRSALLGAAIGIQAAVSRRAGNYPIQSTGSRLCKTLMARLWQLTRRPIMNIHDELILGRKPTPTDAELDWPAINAVVQEFLVEHRPMVEALNIDFKPITNWSEK